MFSFLDETLCSCQGARGPRAPEGEPSEPDAAADGAGGGPCPGAVGRRALVHASRPGAGPGRARARLPRKVVIQPHLPVRLPCYDFTPLALHTFDASAPFGFGRRLRVQATRVV